MASDLPNRIDRLEEKRRRQHADAQVIELDTTDSIPPRSRRETATRVVRQHGGTFGLAAGFLALATQIVPLFKPTISPEEAAAIRAEMRTWRDERTKHFQTEMTDYVVRRCRDDQKEDRDKQLLPDPNKQGTILPMRPYRDECPPLPPPVAPTP